jgi:large subunit ribosomal protein L4
MSEFNVYRSADGAVEGRAVDTSAFGSRSPRRVQREAVLMYQANRRAGTHATKDRSEINYTKRKPWKQKGTGRARSGKKSSPVWRGGGVAHGPHPRDYSYGVPRKALRAATRAAVAGKVLDGQVSFIDSFAPAAPSTKSAAAVLSALGADRGALLVVPERDDNAWRSVRNLPRVAMMVAADVNAYEVLRHHALIFVGDAMDQLAARVGQAHMTESEA